MGLAGVPLIDLLPLLAGLLVRAPVGGDEGAVQDQVGKSLLSGLFQGLAQRGRLRGEDLDGLVLVPAGGGLGDPEALAQPADLRPVPEPRQGKTACFQQVRARVPFRVPISRRCSPSSLDTNSTSGSGTSRMTR
jgi:hypothetical protein